MTTPTKPSPEAVAAVSEIVPASYCIGSINLRAEVIDRHFAPIIAKAELCDRLAAALKRFLDAEYYHEKVGEAALESAVIKGWAPEIREHAAATLEAMRTLAAHAAIATRAAGPAVAGGGRD